MNIDMKQHPDDATHAAGGGTAQGGSSNAYTWLRYLHAGLALIFLVFAGLRMNAGQDAGITIIFALINISFALRAQRKAREPKRPD